MAEDRLPTPEEVAERLAISPLTAVRWMRSGSLPGGKLGGKIWRMKESALQAFIAEQPIHPRIPIVPVLIPPCEMPEDSRETLPLAQINELLHDRGWVIRATKGRGAGVRSC